MSGALAMAGRGNQLSVSVTVGSINDINLYTVGYSDGANSQGGAIGAASPSSIKGANISLISGLTSSFRLIIQGTLVQTFIQAIIVQQTNGTISRLLQSAATFTSAISPGYSAWTWSSAIWTTTGTRFVLISY